LQITSELWLNQPSNKNHQYYRKMGHFKSVVLFIQMAPIFNYTRTENDFY